MNRLTVAEAARRLGVSQQFVRIGLQRGILPFGYAVKMSDRYTYHISRKKLNEYESTTDTMCNANELPNHQTGAITTGA